MPNNKNSPLDMFLNQQDDCERPACEDTVNALSSALNRLNKKNESPTKKSETNAQATTVSCPPSKDVIGSSSWTLLHSMVSWKEKYLRFL